VVVLRVMTPHVSTTRAGCAKRAACLGGAKREAFGF
jgi:hypothetical protein